MQTVKINKGYNLKLAGAPQNVLVERETGPLLGLDLHGLSYVKPRVAVVVGQKVKIGDLLFYDKNEPDLKFLSPAAGEISAIEYGARRALKRIIIKRDDTEDVVPFPVIDDKTLTGLTRAELIQHIAQGGLWYLLRELPFRKTADMAKEPRRIFVCLDSLEPFMPDPKIYLAGQEDLFQYGLNVLRKLCPQEPVIIINAQNTELKDRFKDNNMLGFAGPYPAHDPGVLLYHTKKSSQENYAWYIDGQDLLLIARLLRNGRYPTEKIYAVGGVPVPGAHVKARIGASVTEITRFAPREHWRVIAGSVFNGAIVADVAFAGPLDKAFFVINTGDRRGKFVAWMLFGVKTVTSFRAHLSAWLPKRKRALNTNLHGGPRSCISCNQCAKLCPVDMLPNLTFKALLAGEIEEALAHGLLDCAECGLCSYGCPSKIELTETFVKAKADFFKESA